MRGDAFSSACAFVGGSTLGGLYYFYFLQDIPFPPSVAFGLLFGISSLLGVGNAICVQLRCISLLTLPMFCGKPGRGVLKAVMLTYVIAGPITNMGTNAREVVRVFACSTELSYNLSKAKYSLLAGPFKKAMFGLKDGVGELEDALSSFRDVAAPIEGEIEGEREINKSRNLSDYIDDLFGTSHRSDSIERKYRINPKDSEQIQYQKMYLKKLEYRCQDQLSRAVAVCIETFKNAYEKCQYEIPHYAAWLMCWPMKITYICNVMHLIGGPTVCDSEKQVDPGLGEGYFYLKKAKEEITDFNGLRLQYQLKTIKELSDIQDAKETGRRVMHAFEEKMIILNTVITAVKLCVALLFLRIITAAASYHEQYLTNIGHDNVYITSYFKRIDKRRREENKYTLLPLKKMERSRYIDVHSIAYVTAERNKLFTQVLKVMLEMITATTFVMLDRLFYEALDVVRQHAEMEVSQEGTHDLEIQVEGTGLLANIVRRVLSGLNCKSKVKRTVTNKPCLPRPRAIPSSYYVDIYGGYLFILLLLYCNPYTMRLRRLICSWFYARREKQRVLHLYNDILKKRMKMQKTLRRKAVQAVRAHYLSGENLLSLRMKFPQLLDWLGVFPAARMKCLICGETAPRKSRQRPPEDAWHSCASPKCPFMYCPECWCEVGSRCLACDPSLAELSDVDSLSDDEQPRY